jgi:hypothetical protein
MLMCVGPKENFETSRATLESILTSTLIKTVKLERSPIHSTQTVEIIHFITRLPVIIACLSRGKLSPLHVRLEIALLELRKQV